MTRIIIAALLLAALTGCAALKSPAKPATVDNAVNTAQTLAQGGCSLLPPAMRAKIKPIVDQLSALDQVSLMTALNNPPPKELGNGDQTLVYSAIWSAIKLGLANFTDSQSWLAAAPAVAESAVKGCDVGLILPVY